MLCDNCHNRVATIHLTQVINNNKVEVHLCESCAKDKNYMNFNGIPDISSFFNSILGFTAQPYVNTPKAKTCDFCGMTFDNFKASGKFGCANCYETFADRIDPIVKRIHGSAIHSGRLPKSFETNAVSKVSETDLLKRELEELIKLEKFEEAAEVRDKIKDLENGKKEE